MDPGGIALALLAGAVAAFNPCGFALLPAYLSVLVVPPRDAGQRAGPARARAVLRAVRFSAGMTVGFVVVFGIAAVVLVPFAVSIGRHLPVVTVVIGAVLLGVRVLAGGSLALPRLAVPSRAPTTTWASQVGYGATFALASLSCTIAPFLAVTTTALGTGSAIAVVATYTAYAIGMATVVTVLAIAAAVTASSIAASLRRATPWIVRFSGVLLLTAGAYVAWYGWFEMRVLSDPSAQDPIVAAVTRAQSAATGAVLSLGAPAIGVAALAVAIVVTRVWRHVRARRAAENRGEDREVPRGGRHETSQCHPPTRRAGHGRHRPGRLQLQRRPDDAGRDSPRNPRA